MLNEPIRIGPETGLPVGDPCVNLQIGNSQEAIFPARLNRKFTAHQSFRMQVSRSFGRCSLRLLRELTPGNATVITDLLPLTTKVLAHWLDHGAKRKALEVGTRAMCGKF
jgi:hypothetical protein